MRVSGRMDFTTAGPKEMFGTKWPSMMSRCSQSAPDRSTRRASSAERLKSDARNEGAIIMGVKIEDGGWRMEEGNDRRSGGGVLPADHADHADHAEGNRQGRPEVLLSRKSKITQPFCMVCVICGQKFLVRG